MARRRKRKGSGLRAWPDPPPKYHERQGPPPGVPLPPTKQLKGTQKHHAALTRTFTTSAEINLKHMQKAQSCRVRFDRLSEAINNVAKAWSHGFGSQGRVHKGAMTPRTVSSAEALRLYNVDQQVTDAAQRFRSECLKDEGRGFTGPRKRRR